MRPDRTTLAAFVGFVLIAGAVSVAIRLGSFELPPFWAAGLRYFIAGIIFAALAVTLHIPFPRGTGLRGITLASLCFVVSTGLFYVGLTGAPAAMGAIAFGLSPLITVALAAAIGIERFTIRGVLGALIAAAGMVVIVGDQLGAAVPVAALVALAGAVVFGSATSVVLKRLPPGHPISANAVWSAIGVPILLGLSVLGHESWALPNRPETWLSLAFLVLGGTVLLFPLALFIIRRWTASGYSYTGLLEPLVAVGLAAIILAEPIRLTLVLGGALILGGVWVGAFSAPSVPSPTSDAIEADPNLLLAPVAVDDGVVG